MGGAGENAATEDKLPTIRDHTGNSENTKQQNSSMSVRVCRRSSAQDFLRDADFAGLITVRGTNYCFGPQLLLGTKRRLSSCVATLLESATRGPQSLSWTRPVSWTKLLPQCLNSKQS